MNVAVLHLGRALIGQRSGEIAEDRIRSALGNLARSVVVAHERRDLVATSHKSIENGRTDVAGGAGEEDSHRGRIS